MAGKSKSGDRDGNVTVSFGAKFARSDQFKTVFREGMALVKQVGRASESLNASFEPLGQALEQLGEAQGSPGRR